MSETTTYAQLAARFATEDHARVNKGGGDQTYVPAEKIISRLNGVLGVGGWSFTVLREGFTPAEAWVLGEITATIDGQAVTRQQYGDQPLTVGRGDREKPVADLMKKAGTNALKKCATLLGVALYLYDEDERLEVEAEMREASRPKPPAPKPAPTPADDKVRSSAIVTGADPTPLKTKLELVADLKRGLEYARSIGIQMEDIDAAPMNRAEIEDAITALRQNCRDVLNERKKTAAS
jgi:hypothetical protein